MENENQKSPSPSNQPTTSTSEIPSPSQHGAKVIQPSQSMIKEMAGVKAEEQKMAHSTDASSYPQSPQATLGNAKVENVEAISVSQTPRPNPNSIYPSIPNSNLKNSNNLAGTSASQEKRRLSLSKIVGYIFIFIVVSIVLGFLYHEFIVPKVNSSKGALLGHSYTTHDIKVGSTEFRVNFDRSATITSADSSQAIMSGNDLKGNKMFVTVKAESTPKVSPSLCEGSGATIVGSKPSGWLNEGTINILNSPAVICEGTGVAYTAFHSGTAWYVINFTMSKPDSQSIDLNTIDTIARSLNR
jgi:hypothetical protein